MRLGVTELNNQIKAILENHFELIEVEAEISQITYHHTGHIYFSIKDENSMLNCAMWRSSVRNLKFKLEAGMKVIIYGALNVYTPRGEYKLIATKITPSGVGDLQFAYEQLKKELLNKGYFAQEIKKSLPKYPTNVAIITANPSAALSDMLKIASKRWPLVKFYIYNSLMQGENAKFDIAKNIELADKNNHEVIIIARGGGSLEDLWSFNTIEVAEAIYKAKTPIISAIGHEVDVMISDYVADVRASTPSNAMEILLPDMNEHLFGIDELIKQFKNRYVNLFNKKKENLNNLWELYRQNSIQNQFQHKFNELNTLYSNFTFYMEYILNKKSDTLNNLEKLYKYHSIDNKFEEKLYEISILKEEFNKKSKHILDRKSIMLSNYNFNIPIKIILQQKENILKGLINNFKLSNPENRDKKGFVQVKKDNKLINLEQLKKDDIITLSNTKKILEAKILK